MRSSLFDYEWQFLTQMITRIHYTASYEELCRLLLEDQLPTLIPFDRAVVFQTGRQNGQGTVAAPYTVGMPNDPKKNPFLDRAVIPRWSQFIMAPHSTVFLQSDLIAAEDWIHSDIYRNIWEPCRLYWALGATIQYRDRPLALVALFRDDPQVVAYGALALRYQCITFCLQGWVVMGNMCQQTMGLTVPATFMAVARQGLFFIPMVWILSAALGFTGVQLSQSAADLITFAVSIPVQARILRELPQDKIQKTD